MTKKAQLYLTSEQMLELVSACTFYLISFPGGKEKNPHSFKTVEKIKLTLLSKVRALNAPREGA